MKKLKILQVCKSHPDSYQGGIQTHTWKIGHEMAAAGHEVYILTAGGIKPTVSRKEGMINVIYLFYLPGRFIPIKNLFLEEFFFNISAWFFILFNQRKFDVVHTQGRSGYLMAFTPLKKWIGTFHGLLNQEMTVNQNQKGLAPKISSMFEKKLIGNIPSAIAVSESLRQDIFKIRQHNHITVVPNGVDMEDIPEKKVNTNKDLIFVGRLEKGKGIYDLLEAFSQSSTAENLIIIGDGSEYNNLKEKISKTKALQNRVVLTGSLPHDKVRKHIMEAHTLILPSYLETQGIVLLEAMAAKTCVIASDIPGINEVVKHHVNGLLFPCGNITALTNAIDLLLADKHLEERLTFTAYDFVQERYQWSSIANDLIKIYNRLG